MDSSDALDVMHIRLGHVEYHLAQAREEISLLKSENRAVSSREDFLLGEIVNLSSDLRDNG